MNRFDEIKELIRVNPSIVEFADFGNGVAEGWIAKAEEAIGMRLPASYRWWLENYSGGEIGGEEIFSVYEEDFDSTTGGNIVSMHRIYQKSPYAKTYRIPICHSDIDGVFYFDSSLPAENGEYAVFSEATGDSYASDFFEFLKKRIEVASS